MKSKLLLCTVFLLVIQILSSQTRDPFLHPFAVESIWNLPLHQDAWLPENNVDANIDVVGIPQYLKAEVVKIYIEDPGDPLREFHRVYWSDRCTNHHHYENNFLHFPDDFVFNGEGTGNANAAWVMFKEDRNTIWDGTLFTRCTAGEWVGGSWFGPGRPYSILGSGAGDPVTDMYDLSQVDIWGHGASRISALGGLIRKGELTSPESEPIQHALKFTIRAHKYLCDCDLIPHAPMTWPAQGHDHYACDDDAKNVYRGTNPNFLMGSLLAIPPDLTKEDLNLTTLVARKIFDALQTYGAYVVEDAGASDNWQFLIEEDAVSTDWPQGDFSRFNSGIYYEELTRIIAKLHIITKNNPDNIGGGPSGDHANRLASVACPLGTFGSGVLCVGDYIPDTSVEISGCPQYSLTIDQQIDLDATVLPVKASSKSVRWTSSNVHVASVGMSGVITAIAEGTTFITATTIDGGNTDMCEVSVSGGTGGTTSRLFSPVADGSVIPGFTSENIQIDGSNTNHIGYLKFSIEGTRGMNFTGCRLNLYSSSDNSSGTIGIYLGAHNDWDESNVGNLPANSAFLGEVTSSFESGKWYEWNLPTLPFYGDGEYTFIIIQEPGGNAVGFDSRESSNGPVLLMDLASSGPDVYPPKVPENLVAGVAGDSISLIWDSNFEEDLQGYNLYRSNNSGGPYNKLNNEVVLETGYTDKTVTRYKPYYYVVAAIDSSNNESLHSVEVMGITAKLAATSTLYSEDFDDNLAQGWIVNSGTWQIIDNQYDQSATGSVVTSFYDMEAFSDYNYTFNVYPIWKNFFGAVFNYQDDNNYYALEIHAGLTKAVRILQIKEGVSTSVAGSVYSDEVHQHWNEMEIQNSNGYTTVVINGNTVLDNIETPTYSNGKIGLYVNNSKVIYDNIAVSSLTVVDTINPTPPQNLVLISADETSFDLSWEASIDSGGVAAYHVFASNMLKATVPASSASISGLPCDSLMEVYVIAVDSSGNISDIGDKEFFSTNICTDITPPGIPDGLSVTDITSNSLTFRWNPSGDNMSVVRYKVYLNGSLKEVYETTHAIIAGLECNTEYTLGVRATDEARNLSEPGTIQAQTANCPDTHPPDVPSGIKVQEATQTTLDIGWNPSADNIGTTGYLVFVNNILENETTNNSVSLSGLECGTSYYISVRAKDEAGNNSLPSNPLISETTVCPDIIPPAAPSGLLISDIGQTSARLSWNPSTDNIGVTAYQIYINGVLGLTLSDTTTVLEDLECENTYQVFVKAEDAEGNTSEGSDVFSFDTKSCQNTGYVSIHSNSSLLKVFPMPFGDELFIDFGNFTGMSSIRMHNLLGQQVYQKELITGNNTSIKIVDDLPAGVYVLQVVLGRELINIRVIKK